MSSSSKPPPMAHSAAYYDRRTSPRSSHFNSQYPPPASLAHPPAAHVNPNPNSKSYTSTHRTDPNRAQSSVSSGESGSTVASDYKPYLQKQTYQHSPQLERALPVVDDGNSRQSYFDSQTDTRVPISNHGQSEMIEDQSAVYRYIQQHQQAEEEEVREDDHALWILVR